MDELIYSVWLSQSCTPGQETFAKLLDKFKNPKAVFEASDSAIAACISSSSRDYNALTDKDISGAEKILSYCRRKNIGILTYFDPIFPDALKKIKNPPVLLYYRGKLPDFKNNFFISIVGTRKLTEYGKKHTFKISYDLARSGATIVSGMAVGIDGVALAGALAASVATVAVIGSGIDVCYPESHITLAKAIVKDGCVMTEYAPGTRPERYNFPVRNRIISALSTATLVMEGNERSGALITARHAKEQGRHVYAFPGNVDNKTSEATNLLIKNGAKLFTSADDIVRDFDALTPGKLNPFELAKNSSVNMHEILSELHISCVTINDGIFNPKIKKQNREDSIPKVENINKEKEQQINNSNNNEKVENIFDKSLLSLYKKIPYGSSCSVESLIDSEHSMKDVMQGLLKLEIAKFIVMLPGDRVKRNM